MDNRERLKELQDKLEDLKKRWPAHSVKPHMIEEREELEEEIEEIKKLINEDNDN